jgi:hypothetical protein
MAKQIVYAAVFTGNRFRGVSQFLLTLFTAFVIGESAVYSQCTILPPAPATNLVVTNASTLATPTTTPNAGQVSGGSGLVAQWKFDEGSGTIACDSSGNGNTATLVNGPLWTAGIVGNALYFDGVDDNLVVAASNSLNLSSVFTLAAWVNPASAATDFRSIVTKNYTYYLYASVAGYCGDGSPLGGFSEATAITACQPAPLPANTWTHLAVTYDGSTLTLYRNGVAVVTSNFSGALSPSTGTLQIGASQYGEYFQGLIDEVRIYNRALSVAEIQTIYQQESVTQPFDFSLTSSGDTSVTAGSSVTNSVSATLASGSSQAVSFLVSGLPSGATGSFSSASCSPTCSSVLTISTAGSTSTGNFSVTVSATGGGVTKTTAFTLSVTAPVALVVATPTITPNGGSFSGSVSVTMQSATSGASIYYTTDGSTPTQSSALYTGAMTLTSSATVNAEGFKSGYTPSPVGSASFVLAATGTGGFTYYISPNGNDSTGDGNSGNPYKTFAKLAGLAQPGITFILKDGTYNTSNSGDSLTLNCATSGGNTANGTVANPIVVEAQNERQAFIQNSGSSAAVTVSNCNYWTFLGLRAESQDLAGSSDGNVVEIYNSSNIQFKRSLVRKNNRYTNSMLLVVEGNSANVLIEENEFYEHHRGGLMFTQLSHDNIARRNYCNSRNYPDIVGGYGSINPTKGDECFMNYPSYNNIFENNITENENVCFNTQASGPSDNNRFYGNIGLGCNSIVKSYNTTPGNTPQDNVYVNHVLIGIPNVTSVPLYFRTQRRGRCDNCTILASNTNAALVSDIEAGAGDGGPYSFYATNLLILRTANPNTYGVSMSTTFGIDHANSYGSNTNFSPFPSASYTNTSTTDPALGGCYAWVPATSPMKGAGISGTDTGANVLYVYQNGILTTNKLWDTTNNTFASAYLGANVAGVTDVAGSSLRNIGARLHLGLANGCDYPAGY